MAQFDMTQTVSRPLWLAARSNRGFISGSSATQISIVSNFKAVLANPSDSNRLVIIDKVTGFSSVGNPAARIWLNPTTGLPTTSKPVNSLRTANQSTNKATVKIDSSLTALSGGTDTGVDLVFNSGIAVYDDPFILDPGQSIGVNIFTLLGATTYTLDIRWYEDAL